MSNASTLSENSNASGNLASVETVGGSTSKSKVTASADGHQPEAAAYNSTVAQNSTETQDATEHMSLKEKTRLGFIQEHENTKIELTPKSPESVPVRPSITLDQIGNSAGALLRYNRERLGYSRKEIAKALQVRDTTVADLENDALAQETAVKFTECLLARYATILNLDTDTVISLYKQKVYAKIKITQEKSAHKKKDHHLRRDFFIIVLILIVAGCGYVLFGGEEPKTDTSEQSAISGQLSADGQEISGQSEIQAPVIIEDPNNAKSEVTPLSENTVKAQAQAQALSSSQKEQIQLEDKQPVSLPLNDQTIERKKAEQAKVKEQQAKEQAAKEAQAQKEQVAKDASKDAAKDASAKEQVKGAANKDSQETKVAQEDKAEPAPSLNRQLKDISSQVKIVNRGDGIPSLNKLEITVLKDVALEVTGSGKSLKSGMFKSGEVIKLTSIPPFVISVSDTTAIRINYLEGVLQTPNAKQVIFELPTR